MLRAVSQSRVRPLLPRAGGGWTINPEAADPDAATAYDDLLLLHLDGSLYTGNAQPTQDAILDAALGASTPAGGRRPRGGRGRTGSRSRSSTPWRRCTRTWPRRASGSSSPGWPDVRAAAGRSRWFAGFDAAGGVQPTVDAAITHLRAVR